MPIVRWLILKFSHALFEQVNVTDVCLRKPRSTVALKPSKWIHINSPKPKPSPLIVIAILLPEMSVWTVNNSFSRNLMVFLGRICVSSGHVKDKMNLLAMVMKQRVSAARNHFPQQVTLNIRFKMFQLPRLVYIPIIKGKRLQAFYPHTLWHL